MPTYLTARDLQRIFQKKSIRTIYRWVEEQREIRLDGQVYVPEKDAGGCLRFIVRSAVCAVSGDAEDQKARREAAQVRGRRMLSRGVV